ncbi:MAG TPA: hypothetical protein VFS43_10710 [Polyangiaceae bacterium]|nr:hypothetical protein [Polyangiaceae bacterium]
MKSVYDTLHTLFDWRSGPDTLALSLYLDVAKGRDDEALAFARRECEALLDARADGASAGLAALVRDELEALPAEIDRARSEGYEGLALFLSAEPLLRERVRLRFSFENSAELARAPRPGQLLYFAEEYEASVAVVVGPGGVRVVGLEVGDVKSDHPLRPSHGRSLAAELNVELHRRVHERPSLHVIFLGEPAARDALEAGLDRGLAARVIGRVDRALAPDDAEFLISIHRVQQAHERRAEEEGVARLAPAHEAGEPVALGVDETIDAINRGTLAKLYLLQDLPLKGWVCDGCDYLGTLPAPPACVACGASVSAAPLEEHIVAQAAACGAEIETVFESATLGAYGGVAGLRR